MKIALILAGQPRTFKFCYPSFKRLIIDVYNPDIFIVSDDKETELRQLYNPVAMEIKTQDYINQQVAILRDKYRQVDPQFEVIPAKDLSIAWKLYRAAQLKQEYEKIHGLYDIVIVTRFDIKFKSIQATENVDKNTIYVPKIGAYWIIPPDKPGIHWHGYSAHLCWMSSKVFDKLAAEMYFEGDNHYRMSCEVNKEWGFIPEHVFKYFLERHNINVELVDIDMMLIRGTSERPLAFHNLSLDDYPYYKERE